MKNSWKDGFVYKGTNTFVRHLDNNPFELQFHTLESFKLKNGLIHKLYEEQRSLPKDLARWIELNEQMITLSKAINKPIDIEKVRKKI